MTTRIHISLLALGVGLLAPVAHAHEVGVETEGHSGNHTLHATTSGTQDCHHSGFWDQSSEGGCAMAMLEAGEPRPRGSLFPSQEVMTLQAGALFDLDKSDLKPEGISQLGELAEKIKSGAKVVRIGIEGHTDSIASESYNQGLSERRAAAVKNHLVSLGLDSDIMSTRGFGELKPVATNATAEGRARNRRVEVIIETRQ